MTRRAGEEAKEFSDAVRGTSADEQQYRRYVLAELRCARVRALMLVKEIEAIGVALRHNVIFPEMALIWLADANALDFLLPMEPAWEYAAGSEPKESTPAEPTGDAA